MNRSTIFIVLLTLFIFNGCVTTGSSTAKNYLKLKEIDKGLIFTSQELKNNPNDVSMNYYHGRYLIVKKRYKEAIPYLKKASELSNGNAEYAFRLGLIYGKIKEYTKERQQYQKILNEKGRYKKALIYLGRNYYKTKQYPKALETFEEALNIHKKSSYMFYYYALTLQKTNQNKKSIEYFLKYLTHYPNLSKAKKAVYNLNKFNDFTYSNFSIGDKIISIRNMDYLENSNEIESYSKQSLNIIGKLLLENKNLKLNIVSYDKDNLKDAEIRVKNIKKYILNKFPEIDFSRLKIGWVKTKKIIKIRDKNFDQNQYVNFFTTKIKDKKETPKNK